MENIQAFLDTVCCLQWQKGSRETHLRRLHAKYNNSHNSSKIAFPSNYNVESQDNLTWMALLEAKQAQ